MSDVTEAISNDLPNLHQWLPLLSESLAQQGRFRWQLRGASMLPTLPPGCEIEIVPPPATIPLGALLVFASRTSLVAHRLVYRADPFLVAQGDNRREPDPWLRPNQVLGVVLIAHQGERRLWPTRWEPILRWVWIGRAGGLWLLRRFKRLVNL
jgi:hypothetical protein